jgi:hypothetical protein
MKYKFHGARDTNKLAHVLTDEFETRIARQVRDIIRGSGYRIVNRDYAKAFREQPIGKMRTEKSRSSCYDCGLGRQF